MQRDVTFASRVSHMEFARLPRFRQVVRMAAVNPAIPPRRRAQPIPGVSMPLSFRRIVHASVRAPDGARVAIAPLRPSATE